mmetsp:Transcript_11794/g.33996  ORF Transcript_11794/g.33996 Transcript_11794/m.33996 type:complete len:234 (-) Transcript_11794:2112-2813(-)
MQGLHQIIAGFLSFEWDLIKCGLDAGCPILDDAGNAIAGMLQFILHRLHPIGQRCGLLLLLVSILRCLPVASSPAVDPREGLHEGFVLDQFLNLGSLLGLGKLLGNPGIEGSLPIVQGGLDRVVLDNTLAPEVGALDFGFIRAAAVNINGEVFARDLSCILLVVQEKVETLLPYKLSDEVHLACLLLGFVVVLWWGTGDRRHKTLHNALFRLEEIGAHPMDIGGGLLFDCVRL